MTTIVSDGVRIASDSQTTCGNERSPDATTKVLVDDYRVFCLSGAVCLFEPLINWYKAGCIIADRPQAPDDYAYNLWVFDPDLPAPLSFHRPCAYPDTLGFPCAMGSGRAYALGALDAGASLEDAVKIAAKWDVYTGGEIRVTDIPEKPQLQPREETCYTRILKSLGLGAGAAVAN